MDEGEQGYPKILIEKEDSSQMAFPLQNSFNLEDLINDSSI
jgi:hypothetical protein